jgi:hypothetical protein
MAGKGYNGGDGEPQLIAALRELLDAEESDTVTRIKSHYWKTGNIVEIAIARGYTKAAGLQGWFFNHFGKGVTHAKECLQCWKNRETFDRAYAWWRAGNTGFTPTKLSGPRFANELCKAYGERLTTDADKLASRNQRKLNAKALREQAAAWRQRYDRLKGEHLKWADEDQREPRVLHSIELEIAADEDAEQDSDLPLKATRPSKFDPDSEGAPTDDVTQTTTSAPYPSSNTNGEQHPGGSEDLVVMMRDRTNQQLPASLYVVPPDTPIVQEDPIKPMSLVDVAVPGDELVKIEIKHNLNRWPGLSRGDDELLRQKRAAYYMLCGEVPAENNDVVRKLARGFWREVGTKLDVDARIPAERNKQAEAVARKQKPLDAVE